MKKITAITCATALLASAYASAAAHRLHVQKSIVIDATAAQVWEAAKNFDGLNTWHPAVATDEIVEGKNNIAGAVRLLTLKGGGTIKEQLVAFDEAHRKFRYKILESVLPVSGYSSTFAVKSAGKHKASVTWSGWFTRKDPSDHASAPAEDKTAVDTITGVYQSGLDNLKKIVEGK